MAFKWQAELEDVEQRLLDAERIHGDQDHLPWMVTYSPGAEHHPGWRTRGYTLELRARRMLSREPDWASLLMEEVGELLQADTPAQRRTEALQVAAMALQIARLAR